MLSSWPLISVRFSNSDASVTLPIVALELIILMLVIQSENAVEKITATTRNVWVIEWRHSGLFQELHIPIISREQFGIIGYALKLHVIAVISYVPFY